MLSDLAEEVLSDSGVDLNANDHIESHVFLLIIEKLRARVGAEMVDATLDEIIKYFFDTERTSQDDLSRIAKIARPAAPVTPENLAGYQELLKFDKIFINLIKSAQADDFIGLITYSAIRYGLLLDDNLICSWCDQNWLTNLRRVNDEYWFVLNKPKQKIGMVWTPDNFTLALISKFHDRFKKNNKWFFNIKKLLDKHMDSSGLNTKNKFLSAMKALLHNYYPGFIIESLSNRKNNRGLSEIGHIRRITRLVPPNAKVKKRNCSKKSRKNSKGKSLRIITDSLKVVSSSDEFLEKIKHVEFSPVVKLIIDCSVFYANNETEAGTKLKISAIYRIINDLTDRFTGEFKDQDLQFLPDEELLDRFKQVILNSKEHSKFNIQKSINYFLWFLHNYQNRPRFSINIVISRKSEPHPVMIFPWEYSHVHKVLKNELRMELSDDKKILINFARMALILGYRLGLRRGEIQNIRLCDFHMNGFPMLVVTPYEDKTQKSIHSNRNIAIGGRFSSDEMIFLNEFLEWRRKNSKSNEDLFLDWDSEFSIVTNRNKIFLYLSTAFRMITSDPICAFHTLRHSFASNNMFYLQLRNDESIIENNFLGLDVEQINEFKNYYDRVKTLSGGTRVFNPLHQLSMELGHASPETTLRNYVHSIDLILSNYQSRLSPELSTLGLADLFDVDRTSIQKKFKSNSDDHLRPSIIYRDFTHKKLKKLVESVDIDSWRSVEDSYHCLNLTKPLHGFDGFLNDLKKFDCKKITLRQLLMRYPELRKIRKDFLLDKALYDFLVKHNLIKSKDLLDSMIENLSKLADYDQRCRYKRWCTLRRHAENITLENNAKIKNTRGGQALVYLIKSLG